MPDVRYELRGEDAVYHPTYTANGHNALLAKHALATHLARRTQRSFVNRCVDTRTDPIESGSIGHLQTSTMVQEADYARPVLQELPERVESSEVDTDEMSTDLHLVFISIGEAEEFLQPLVRRVQELTALAKMEDDQHALRSGSLRGFFKFLYLHRSRVDARPQLMLTSEGSLRAIWRRSRDHRVAIRFLDDSTVSFVTFLPDEGRPTQINRMGGECSIEGFFRCVGLKALGVEYEQNRDS